MSDQELWAKVLDRVQSGAIRPQYAAGYWFERLGAVLDGAASFAKDGDRGSTVQKLRELQAQCEQLIGTLEPEQRARPKLVGAA